MFQYISDILKQFSSGQKMLALVVLLISIISITYITMITKTPEELTKTVTVQRQAIIKNQQYISDLSQQVNLMNDSIMRMNHECNSRAIEREKVYTQKMIEQQKYVNETIDEIKQMMINKSKSTDKVLFKNEFNTSDSVFTVHSPITVTTIEENKLNKQIINKLDKIKKKIK